MTAAEMAANDPDKLWNRYYKFAFVRNPWERAISEYLWRQRRKDIRVAFDNFEAFLEAALDGWDFEKDDARHLLPQKAFVTSESGELLVDVLGRIERFDEDMERICNRIGTSYQYFPHINDSDSLKSNCDLYTLGTRKLVKQLWGEDIDYFGYEFPISMGTVPGMSSGSKSKISPSPTESATTLANMKPQLYLHIGHGKTGSTTIQQALQDNIDALRTHGLLVADKELNFPESGPIEGHPLLLFRDLFKETPPENARARLERSMKPLLNKLAKGEYRGAVISSENLSSPVGAKLFEGLTEMFKIHVIYYVRRQDEWIESAWKEWGLKTGADICEYAKTQIQIGRPDYLKIARAWQKITKKLHVVPINGVPDITLDFWNALGLKNFTPDPTAFRNQTFDWSVLDILSRNPYLFSCVQDNKIFNLLERLLPEDAPREGRGLLPPQLSKEIMDSHRESNELLQSEFFQNLHPLNNYPSQTFSEKAGENWGSIVGIHRYLGVELLMHASHDSELKKLGLKIQYFDGIIQSLEKQLYKVPPERIDKIIIELDNLKKDSKALRKHNKLLERKIEETDKKMARSLTWRIKKVSKKIFKMFT